MLSDFSYDAFENILAGFEARHPELVHKDSPTRLPGSDQPKAYPSSIRRCFEGTKDFTVDVPVWEERFRSLEAM